MANRQCTLSVFAAKQRIECSNNKKNRAGWSCVANVREPIRSSNTYTHNITLANWFFIRFAICLVFFLSFIVFVLNTQ